LEVARPLNKAVGRIEKLFAIFDLEKTKVTSVTLPIYDLLQPSSPVLGLQSTDLQYKNRKAA